VYGEFVLSLFSQLSGVFCPGEWIYGVPFQARRSWAWATPALLMLGLGVVILVAGLLVLIAFDLFPGLGSLLYTRPALDAASPPDPSLLFVIAWMLLLGLAAIALFIAWARWFERRGLASLGLIDPRWKPRVGLGLLAGVGIALAIGWLGPVIASFADGPVTPSDDWLMLQALTNIAGLGLAELGGLAAFILSVAVYACAEEVVFRGWLLSAISARWGAAPGILLSSALFAAYHSHLYAGGLAYGNFWMLAMGFSGVVFCLLAMLQKSLFGAMGLHAGFNLFLAVGDSLVQAGDPENGSFSDILSTSLDVTSDWPEDARIALTDYDLADPVVFTLVALVLLQLLAKQPRFLVGRP
jgi:membrane protease YdiL (CAAX protease family)